MDLLFATFSVLPLALIVLLVVGVVGGRGEGDPTGRRVHATYLFVVVFVTLVVALGAAAAIVGAIASSFGSDAGPFGDPSFGGSFPDIDGGDEDAQRWRTILQSLAMGSVAAGILVFHARLARDAVRNEPDATAQIRRVFRTYVHVACLVAILVALFAAANTLYSLVRLAAPGLTALGNDSYERDEALRSLMTSAFLAIAGGATFVVHWRMRGRELAQGSADRPVMPAAPS